jgi:hypothetical protein
MRIKKTLLSTELDIKPEEIVFLKSVEPELVKGILRTLVSLGGGMGSFLRVVGTKNKK